jgi:hypothetical protein
MAAQRAVGYTFVDSYQGNLALHDRHEHTFRTSQCDSNRNSQ